MSLDFILQQAPMRFGLAEGVDPHQVPFGTLMTAENVCWDKSGRIQKRLGIASLTSTLVAGGSLASIGRLIVRGTELACTDGTNLYSYTSSGWVSRGKHPELGVDWYTSLDNVTGVGSCDMAILSNGQAVEAWVNKSLSGTLYYQIRDTTTRTVITTATQVDTSVITGIRLISSGNTWVLLYATGGNLKCLTSTGTTTLKTNVQASGFYNIDACVIGTDFVVVYPTNAGDICLVRYSIANTPVQAATQTIAGEQMYGVSIHGAAGEYLYLSWDNSSIELRFASANPSTLVATAPTTLFTGGFGPPARFIECHTLVRETASTCLLLYTENVTGYTQCLSVDNTGSVITAQITPFVTPMSRPFAWGSRFYCVMSTSNTATSLSTNPVLTTDTFLVDVTRDAPTPTGACRQVAKIDALTGGLYYQGFFTTPCVVSSTEMALALAFASAGKTGFWGGGRRGVRYTRLLKGASLPVDMWRSVQIGPEAYIGAGVLTSYDGVEGLGYGFPYGPVINPDATVAGGGGAMLTGTYQYSCVAERRSHVGILHRSPVAVSYDLPVTGPAGSVSLEIFPASLGQSTINPGHFPVYRSIADGSIPQRLAQEPAYMTAVDSGLGGTYTFTDDDADSGTGPASIELSTRPPLYTAGGELEDTQPPSCLTLTTFQNRIWMVAGDGRTVWFSKDAGVSPGTAPGFYPTNSLEFERAVTALSSMDDKLIVFAADTFWFVAGDGPAPNGQDSTYDVGRVQTDVGCTNPRSVVSTPMGVMFQSSKGLHLLSRQLEVAWLGRPVKDQLAAFPNITSAVLVASRNEVRWTANNTGGTAGIVLVYNYVENQWSTFKYTLGGVYGAPIADACMWNGTYTFCTSGGTVYTESTASYLDGSTWVPITIETAWIGAAGPLAYQSVRNFAVEGISHTNHNLTISVGFDNVTSYAQTVTFLAGSTVTSTGPLESCEISIGTRRKCQAIRFKIQDATPTSPGVYPVTTGQGPSFDAIGIEVGVMKGFARKPATKRG